MRSFDNWQVLFDSNGNPLYGRVTFYKLHTTELLPVYNENCTVPLQNPMPTSQRGLTDVQVFLQDQDYTVKLERWVGAGDMIMNDPNSEDWEDVRTFDNLYPAIMVDTPEGTVAATEASTMADLRSIQVGEGTNVNYVKLLGYYTLGDMPPQYYRLENSPSSTIQDDGGSVIRPEGSTEKIWRLIPQENIDVRVFGVFPSPAITTIQPYQSQLHNCFLYANNIGKDVYMPQCYNAAAYYYVEGGTDSMWQKLVVDEGVHIVAKPLTTTRLRLGKIQYFGKQLFISDGDYGTLHVDCPTVKTSWGCNSWEAWDGDVKNIIVDSLQGPYNFYDADVDFETVITNRVLYFENCLITSNKQMKNCTVNCYNCGEVKDSWLDNCYLVTSNCILEAGNFEDVNIYIRCKNLQGDPLYGDLGERTVTNATFIAGAVAENASLQNVQVLGACELHNVSGTIRGNGPYISLNLIDCWITFINTDTTNNQLKKIDLRRGSLQCSTILNLIDPCLFEDANINAQIVTPYSTSTFKRCTINQPLATFDVEVYNCTINSTVNTYPDPTSNHYSFRIEGNTFEANGYHNLAAGTNAGAIVGTTSKPAVWMNNSTPLGGQHITLDRTNIDPDEQHHNYVYEGNKGPGALQKLGGHWQDVAYMGPSYGSGDAQGQLGSKELRAIWSIQGTNNSGIAYLGYSGRMFRNDEHGGGHTDPSYYLTQFNMFSVGTQNVGQLFLTGSMPSHLTEAMSQSGTPYNAPVPLTQIRAECALDEQERLWYSSNVGTPKNLAFIGGFTWRVTCAPAVCAVLPFAGLSSNIDWRIPITYDLRH